MHNKYKRFWSLKEKLVFKLFVKINSKIKKGINIPICFPKKVKGRII